MQGLKLTDEATLEVTGLVPVSQNAINAVAATPGWNTIGNFTMGVATPARIESVALVSDASLTLRVRLFDVTAGSCAEVSGSTVATSATVDAVLRSGVFQLASGHTYQAQAECVGGADETLFGIVRYVRLIA